MFNFLWSEKTALVYREPRNGDLVFVHLPSTLAFLLTKYVPFKDGELPYTILFVTRTASSSVPFSVPV